MSKDVKSVADLPESVYYVTAIDDYMSGWGEAESLNIVVFLPDNMPEALAIVDKLHARFEMRKIQVLAGRPKPTKNALYSIIDREDGATWYES